MRVRKFLFVVFLILSVSALAVIPVSEVIGFEDPPEVIECFVKDTPITMGDGTTKPIQDIQVGDVVLGQQGPNTVTSLYQYILGNQPLYSINGGDAFVTGAHPFMTTQGWKAFNVAFAKKWNPNLDITLLEVGDTILTQTGEILVEQVGEHKASYTTKIYNFGVTGDKTYFADEYLVHNKEGVCLGGSYNGLPCTDNYQCPGGRCSTSDCSCTCEGTGVVCTSNSGCAGSCVCPVEELSCTATGEEGICQDGIQTRTCEYAGTWGVWGTCQPGNPEPEVCDTHYLDEDCDGYIDEGTGYCDGSSGTSDGYNVCEAGSVDEVTCGKFTIEPECEGADNCYYNNYLHVCEAYSTSDNIPCGVRSQEICTAGGNCEWSDPTGLEGPFCNNPANTPLNLLAPCSFLTTASSCNGANVVCHWDTDLNVCRSHMYDDVVACTDLHTNALCSAVSPFCQLSDCGGYTSYTPCDANTDCTWICCECDEGTPENPACLGSTGYECDGCQQIDVSGVSEACNNKDDDCDGVIDSFSETTSCVDSNGWGTCTGTQTATCTAGSWSITCDAKTPEQETCNGVDDDCDGSVDEGLTTTSGCNQVGACSGAVKTCSAGSWSACSITPSAETCNNIDDDCDGEIDEEGAVGCTTYYFDADNDGYGTSSSKCLCGPSGNYRATLTGDCDDGNANIHPGQTETSVDSFSGVITARCDGVDNDCSDGDGNAVAEDEKGLVTCYVDADNDDIGVSANSKELCSSSDLYDSDPNVCNGITATNYIANTVPASPLPESVWDDYPFDCDDSDPSAYWKCCGASETLLHMKVGVPGFWSAVDRFDYPWNDDKGVEFYTYGPSRVACCSNADSCVYEDTFGDYVCADRVVPQEFGGDDASDNSIMCDANNAWVDCDDRNFACTYSCGFTDAWVKPDVSATPFGGYTTDGVSAQANRAECCGDDANEHLSVGACVASNDQTTICCDSPGLYNLDGTCVAQADCPDVMKTAPVWVEYPDASWSELAVIESTLDNGYCCNSTSGGDNLVTRPLCQPTETPGCYIELEPVATNDPLARTACATDDECVLENIVPPDSPFQLCEASDACTATSVLLEPDYLTSSVRCSLSGVEVTTTDVGCYKKYDGTSDVSACEPVEITSCTGSDCLVLCQNTSEGITSCSKVCESYSCATETTYRGPNSCTTSTEEVCVTREVINVSTVDEGACEVASFCNEFGCWANGCLPCTSAGCPSCSEPDVFGLEITCNEHHACQSYTSPVGCVLPTSPQNEALLVKTSDDEFLQCSPQPSVKEGDVWCPEGFEYDDGNSRCEEQLAVCDFGPIGNLDIGCDAITTNPDDMWGRYNSGCVWATSPEATTLQTYDYSCCLNALLNDYQLYTDGETEQFVKVY